LKQIFSIISIIAYILHGLCCFSQPGSIKSLQEKVANNAILYRNNLDSAYGELDGLIGQVVSAKDSTLELALLERKCRYFYDKSQPDSLIKAADNLQDKADQYHELYAQAMSNVYLAEAYSINQLYDKALTYLEKAYEILEKDKTNSKKIFLARSNVLGSFANVYVDKGEPKNAVAKLQLVIKNYEVLKDVSDIMRFQYLNYSNIANVYSLYNLDSAEYFALKSIELKPANIEDDEIMLTNYSVLGKVYKEKKSYHTALSYYQKAIQIGIKTGGQLNLKDIYTDLIELYNQTGKKDSAIIYDNKLKELEISILQRKNSSLHMIIDKNIQPNNKTQTGLWIYITIGVGSLLIIIVFIVFFTKNKTRKKESDPQEIYNTLIELVKKNDPAFLFAFEQEYPDFSDHLLEINAELSKSEIEFCALLKLNLSTKEIAQYKFLEPRTVQNKKHRIRKRLNIPTETDIYNWLNSI
jgi:tetratricopeptide (TPR) repeat protein